MRLAIAGILLSTVCLPQAIQAETKAASKPLLWQNVRAGMTLAQVKTAQPTAVSPAEPSTLHGGETCSLEIPATEVLSYSYRVCFFFKDGSLSQVTLNAKGQPFAGQFQGVVTGLRAKYGKELALNKTVLGFEADWLTDDGVNISVLYFDKYGRLLNINYQLRLKQQIEGL